MAVMMLVILIQRELDFSSDSKQLLVQKFIWKLSVKALNESILPGFAWLDENVDTRFKSRYTGSLSEDHFFRCLSLCLS